jgi:hypothetical protein
VPRGAYLIILPYPCSHYNHFLEEQSQTEYTFYNIKLIHATPPLKPSRGLEFTLSKRQRPECGNGDLHNLPLLPAPTPTQWQEKPQQFLQCSAGPLQHPCFTLPCLECSPDLWAWSTPSIPFGLCPHVTWQWASYVKQPSLSIFPLLHLSCSLIPQRLHNWYIQCWLAYLLIAILPPSEGKLHGQAFHLLCSLLDCYHLHQTWFTSIQ